MKNRCIILTVFVSLLVCGGLSSTALAGGSAPVTVVNTPDVIVANTSPIPVTGTVTASGTSNVNVVNTTPIPVTGTVNTAPDPARSAVQQTFNFQLLNGATMSTQTVAIPAGKIFVLETVSFNALVPLNGLIEGVVISTQTAHLDGTTGSINYFLTIPAPPNISNQAQIPIDSLQAVRLYAQPGSTLSVTVSLGQSNSIVSVSLSGYLVNATP